MLAKKIAKIRGISTSELVRQGLIAHLRAEAAKLKAEAEERKVSNLAA